MLIIGITGGSGCGKSTVSGILCEQGAKTIDADIVYHDLLNNSKQMLRELKRRFPEAVNSDGKLIRRELAKIVFSDKQALLNLNEISHKFVLEETERQIACLYEENTSYLCIDAIALFESGMNSICDITIGVLADRETRISRIMERDSLDCEAAAARIDAQQPDDFYISKCNYIIRNDGNIDEVRSAVDDLFKKITEEL